jgi:asparagine synthase (glutamine-hydrolysing)
MCGVTAVYHYGTPERSVEPAFLAAMTGSLAHRGPDDEGLHIDGPVGLGNRRLAIVDLSPTGHQPMVSPRGSAWISYNGECYNHRSLRPRLEARGYTFRGTSDTETLLYALQEWGPGILEELAGIFAFAVWEPRRKRLLLARDPLGVKQLYYHDDGARIVVASEIKALFHYPGVPRQPDPDAINQYLHFHTPLFDRTFFRDIRQLCPGEYIEIGPHGLRRRLFWGPDGFEPRDASPEAQVDDLRDTLAGVVRDQLMSDVPVGCFFSAGIDSSAIAAFALRAEGHIRGFGVHFSDPSVVDERPYQEVAAQALGLDLELLTLDGATFPEDLLRLHYFQDAPVIGPAMIPMYHVSRLAASRVKVCLGGQGGDEIFAGYARYALVQPGRTMSRLFAGDSARTAAAVSGPAPIRSNLLKQLVSPRTLRRVLRSGLHLADWRRRYFLNFTKVSPTLWNAIFTAPGFHNPAAAWQVFDDTLRKSPALNAPDKILHWDMQTYLPGLFHQDDRMSMANSLESRVPLADPRLVRHAFHTPFELKMRGGASKWILRRAVSDVIPPLVLNRRKVGFDTPAEHWMRVQHADFVRDLLLSQRARTRGFWEPRSIERLLGRTRQVNWFDVVWKLASIEAWATLFLDGEGTAVTNAGVPDVASELSHA